MNSIEKLTEIFSRFPGIGPRQAKRFVYHLLNQGEYLNKQLAELILSFKGETLSCASCKKFFHSPSTSGFCKICLDPKRNRDKLLITAKDVDMENIERSGNYDGLYFILGGLLPILEKDPESRIKQKDLILNIEKNKNIKEIILALSATTEGDNTTSHLKKILEPIAQSRGIKISVLGRGLSTGTELEYSDSDTIKNALKNRE